MVVIKEAVRAVGHDCSILVFAAVPGPSSGSRLFNGSTQEVGERLTKFGLGGWGLWVGGAILEVALEPVIDE